MKQTAEKTTPTNKTDRPRYETPRVQVLTERDILNNFQITQSMGAWWTIPTC